MDEFEWWDISELDLRGHLYGILMQVEFADKTFSSWEHFSREEPHNAYAWRMRDRYDRLADGVVSLRLLQKMLVFNGFPLASGSETIGRDEWLSATTDLGLFRIAAIRDQAFHLADCVYDLDIPARRLSLPQITRRLSDQEVIELLSEIASVGAAVRDDRNARAHEGVQVPIGHQPFFKLESMREASGIPIPHDVSVVAFDEESNDWVTRETLTGYDFEADFQAALDGLAEQFLPACRELVEKVTALVDLFTDPFLEKYYEAKASVDSES